MTDGKKFILSPHGSWQLEQLVSERRGQAWRAGRQGDGKEGGNGVILLAV